MGCFEDLSERVDGFLLEVFVIARDDVEQGDKERVELFGELLGFAACRVIEEADEELAAVHQSSISALRSVMGYEIRSADIADCERIDVSALLFVHSDYCLQCSDTVLPSCCKTLHSRALEAVPWTAPPTIDNRRHCKDDRQSSHRHENVYTPFFKVLHGR